MTALAGCRRPDPSSGWFATPGALLRRAAGRPQKVSPIAVLQGFGLYLVGLFGGLVACFWLAACMLGLLELLLACFCACLLGLLDCCLALVALVAWMLGGLLACSVHNASTARY